MYFKNIEKSLLSLAILKIHDKDTFMRIVKMLWMMNLMNITKVVLNSTKSWVLHNKTK